MAGFPGCIGSSDASHIVMEVCPYRLHQLHLGYKLCHTARTYNITVNHRRRILNSTKGHPARFNDKTLVLYDDLINALHDGKYDNSHKFTLLSYDNDGNIINVKYRGCYVIVDNGYLSWSVTVPPLKETNKRSEIRFSEWLESLRKDVECTFEIFESRWRVLRYGIRMHGLLACDRTWLTCLSLHNMLLEVDGLHTKWSDGYRSHWESMDDMDIPDEMPYSIRRLLKPGSQRISDISKKGHGNDFTFTNDSTDDISDNIIPVIDSEGYISVKDMSLSCFRKRLVVHFNIAFKQNKLVWPRRNKDYLYK